MADFDKYTIKLNGDDVKHWPGKNNFEKIINAAKEELPRSSRREFLKYAASVVITAVVVGTGVYYFVRVPPEVITKTTTVHKTIEKTVTKTVTSPTTSVITTSPTSITTSPTSAVATRTTPMGKVSLHIAAFKSPGSEATEKLIPKYLEENPRVEKIIIDHYPYMDLRSKIMTAFVGRTAEFDIVTGDCIWLAEFASGGYLRTIDGYFKDKSLVDLEEFDLYDFFPPVLNYLGRYPTDKPDEADKKHKEPIVGNEKFPLYSIPWLTNTEVMLIREDLYKEELEPAGIRHPGDTAEEAWTLDEMVEAAKILTKPPKRYGLSLQAKRGNSLIWEISNIMHIFGARYFNPDWTPAVNTPEWIKMLKFYISLYKEHKVAPPECLGWEHAEEAGAIASGYCAMDWTWNMELCGWISNPETSPYWDKFGYHWMALEKRGVPPWPPSVQGGYFMAIPVDVKEEKAVEAFKFMVWLTSKEIHKEYVLMGPTPARFSACRDPEVLAKYPYWAFYEKVIQTPYLRPNCPEWTMIEYTTAIEISEALIGKKTVEQAVQDLQDRLYWLMERAGYYSK